MEFLSVMSFSEAQTDAWVASELVIAAVGAQRSGLCSSRVEHPLPHAGKPEGKLNSRARLQDSQHLSKPDLMPGQCSGGKITEKQQNSLSFKIKLHL